MCSLSSNKKYKLSFDNFILLSCIAGIFVIIGALIGVYICKKILKIEVRAYLRYCIPVIPIIHTFGRIGCSIVGCCYGCPFESPISVIYTEKYNQNLL